MTAATRVVAAVAIALVLSVSARASADDAAAKTTAGQALIALRILAYDKNLAERAPGDEVTIVVVSGATPEARGERALWLAAFALMPKVKVGGRVVRVHALEFDNAFAFDAALARRRPAAVIVLQDLAAAAGTLRPASRAHKALTFVQRESAVRAGLAVGVLRGDDKHEIVINLAAARAEGARFDAGLLQLARLVDEAP
jgi:YfiR/HmsC-like